MQQMPSKSQACLEVEMLFFTINEDCRVEMLQLSGIQRIERALAVFRFSGFLCARTTASKHQVAVARSQCMASCMQDMQFQQKRGNGIETPFHL
jgi:hypothetical protein